MKKKSEIFILDSAFPEKVFKSDFDCCLFFGTNERVSNLFLSDLVKFLFYLGEKKFYAADYHGLDKHNVDIDINNEIDDIPIKIIAAMENSSGHFIDSLLCSFETCFWGENDDWAMFYSEGEDLLILGTYSKNESFIKDCFLNQEKTYYFVLDYERETEIYQLQGRRWGWQSIEQQQRIENRYRELMEKYYPSCPCNSD